MKKEILIGLDENQDGIVLELDTTTDYNAENPHFAISGSVYDLNDVFDEETGEDRAREYLEDGEMWKEAVKDGYTTASLDDWTDDVLNIDSWENVIGDVYQIDYKKGLYCISSGGGQIDVSHNFKKWLILKVSNEDLKTILKGWKELHLKDIKDMTKEQLALKNQVEAVFNSYKIFENEQLGELLEEYETKG